MGRKIKCLVCEKWIKLFGTEHMANHVATHDGFGCWFAEFVV
jgi:hypothetical protein